MCDALGPTEGDSVPSTPATPSSSSLPLSAPAPSLPQPGPDASIGGLNPGDAEKRPWASGFGALAGLGVVQPRPPGIKGSRFVSITELRDDLDQGP